MLVLGTIQAMVPGSLYDLMQDYKKVLNIYCIFRKGHSLNILPPLVTTKRQNANISNAGEFRTKNGV